MFRHKKVCNSSLLLFIALLAGIVAGCGSSDTAPKGTGRYFLLGRFNADGSPDNNFHEDGMVHTHFPYTAETSSDFSGMEGQLSAEIHGLAIDKQKRIVAIGWAVVDQKKQIALARYLGDLGDLDKKFADGGRKLLNPPAAKFSQGMAVSLDNEGRILLAGFIQRESGPNYCDFIIARLDALGHQDSKFGKSGVILADFPGAHTECPCMVAVNAQGLITVAGYDNSDDTRSLLIAAKYKPGGAPDTTFGKNGLKAGEMPEDLRFTISDVAVDAAGKMIAAGWVNFIGEKQFALARYTQSGKLDMDFGAGGFVITDIGETLSEKIAAVTVDSKGRIIAAGETGEEDGNRKFVLARYNLKGVPDEQFGEGGVVIRNIPESLDLMVNDITTDAKGKIVLVGQAKTEDSAKHILLARYTENGVIDSTFNKTGSLMPEVPGAESCGANTVVIAPDGKIVFGGWVVFD